jgi:hypothetical protein
MIAIVGGWQDRRVAPSAGALAPEAAQGSAGGDRTGPEVQPSRSGASLLSSAEEIGYVTASLLNCRSAPAEQSRPVRILSRGEAVRILALERSWASVSHRGRQCWTSTRYLSAQRPL